MDNLYHRLQFLHQALLQEIKRHTKKSNVCITSISMKANKTLIEYYEITKWGVEKGQIELLNNGLFK